jgi:hypothetical protein
MSSFNAVPTLPSASTAACKCPRCCTNPRCAQCLSHGYEFLDAHGGGGWGPGGEEGGGGEGR